MNDYSFWEWVKSWLDEQLVLDICFNWNRDLKEDELFKWGVLE